MTSTAGLQLNTRRRWLADTVELLSSMRFAISLLVLIAIASTIGTILKQNEPLPGYVDKFGPFWADIFGRLDLFAIYTAWWFLLIMGLLVVSTSLCIIRNAPKMLKDMRSWRENVREQSLRNFHHKAEWQSAQAPGAQAQQAIDRLVPQGYKVRVFEKEGGTLVAAKRGAANKWGYILAHSAIVIICVGGMLDSDLPIRFQRWIGGKEPYAGGGIIAQIPQKHRLGLNNPSFRGNTFIPEGSTASTAVIPQQTGVLIQDLPFTIRLNRFIIEHYSTGMPKLFASDIVVTDNATGKTMNATVKVNEPFIYRGVAIYQSSFEDGGSRLTLDAYPMGGGQTAPFKVTGEVGGTSQLASDRGGEYTIEWTGFKPMNVENMGRTGQDLRAVNQDKSFGAQLDKQLGSAAKNAGSKDLKNVGPSIQYKLRDKNGQAREFHNYMLPIELDGVRVFLAGMRETPGEDFKYLRIPADDQGGLTEWMRLRAALSDPALREKAAERYAEHAMPAGRPDADNLRAQLRASALKGMDVFAGKGGPGSGQGDAGFFAVARFLERIPEAEQQRAAELFMKILNSAMWELWQAARERDGLPPVAGDEQHGRWLQQSMNALSDASFYAAPVLLELKDFQEVKASVLQLTRSPGKNVVYLGCLLLTLGVFSMLYIRERRLWIWLKPAEGGGSEALMAFSTQRKTLDFEKEFDQLRTQLAQH